MTDPVNLNQFRKVAKKAERQQSAAENSERFGRSKSEKLAETKRQGKSSKFLDMHHLDPEL